MESGSSDELIKALDLCTKKIGITWIVDTSKIKQLEAQ
jgi:fructoselysine-6-P-deglycase FrlB-like protein